MWNNWPWLVAMAILICCSAFFSASEAALFCLRWSDRRLMARGTRSQRSAERLLANPDRLLSAVLFWNLVINITYFTISSIVGLRLDHAGSPQAMVAGFATASVLAIIFFSEMLPKSIAVLQPRALSGFAGLPLALAVKMVDPIMPILGRVNLYSRRLIWPGLENEKALDLDDIERAIEVSSEDEQLVVREGLVLSNIVDLSSTTAREWMRPRGKLRCVTPPVTLENVVNAETVGDFAIIADADGDEVTAVLPLRDLHQIVPLQLESELQEIAIVPWCSSLADVLEKLTGTGLEVAAIVNELGETIGILTIDDIWDAVFSESEGRAERIHERTALVKIDDNLYHVDSMTNLRRLSDSFEVELPETPHTTVAGVVREALERFPEVGDSCGWGPFSFEVLESDEDHVLLAVRRIEDEGEPS